jgi:hypothetical protein
VEISFQLETRQLKKWLEFISQHKKNYAFASPTDPRENPKKNPEHHHHHHHHHRHHHHLTF